MKLKNIIKNIVVSLCVVSSAHAAYPANMHDQVAQLLQYKGKKLVNYCVPVLNSQLAATPVGIARVDLAYNATMHTLHDIEKISDTPAVINAQVKYILAPVKQFFDVIKKFTFMIKPLVEESLLGITKAGSQQTVQQPAMIKDPKDCLLLRFFESTQDVETFFDQTIKTKKDLLAISGEFIYFFKDVKVSMSDEALAAYKKFLENLKPAKK